MNALIFFLCIVQPAFQDAITINCSALLTVSLCIFSLTLGSDIESNRVLEKAVLK